MKITYRREMKHNYLIVDPEALMWRNYECRMLSKNAIDGVLSFQLRQIDDEIRFYYEITSRQPLSRMVDGHPIRERELRQLILGIAGVLDRMEQYLLRENIVLLEPEYIYVEPETFRIWLCLVPGLDRDFPEDYGKLLEYLLGKVDHQDKESVVLAYGLYQETRKENYGMDDILRLMMAEKKPHQDETCSTESVTECMAEETEERASPGQRPRVDVELSKTQLPKLSFREKVKNWLEKPQKGKKNRGEESPNVPWETLFREELNTERSGCTISPTERFSENSRGFRMNRAEAEENFRMNRAEAEQNFRMNQVETEQKFGQKTQGKSWEKPSEPGRNTTLLADFSAENTVIMRKLFALDPCQEDIVLSYYPFIIGKQKHLVDYYLDHETVSRLHVRIDQTEDGWVIQDLNSSNGTMVGGKLLENNESSKLCPGDEVRIAGLRYRFE